LGAFRSGTWICTWRSIPKTKPSRDLPSIGLSPSSRLCAIDVVLAQFRVRIEVGTISAA